MFAPVYKERINKLKSLYINCLGEEKSFAEVMFGGNVTRRE
jgi:hypothetical protein